MVFCRNADWRFQESCFFVSLQLIALLFCVSRFMFGPFCPYLFFIFIGRYVFLYDLFELFFFICIFVLLNFIVFITDVKHFVKGIIIIIITIIIFLVSTFRYFTLRIMKYKEGLKLSVGQTKFAFYIHIYIYMYIYIYRSMFLCYMDRLLVIQESHLLTFHYLLYMWKEIWKTPKLILNKS
jgi:hypothetical protein